VELQGLLIRKGLKELRSPKVILSVAILLFCLHTVSALAWNQLPLLTDSPVVLPPGYLQIDLGLKFLHRQNFPFSRFSEHFDRDVLSLPTVGINFGLGKRVELQLTYEVLFVEEEEFRIQEKWKSGDLAFFTKIELLKERRYVPGMGIKLGAKLPNASDTYRVGTDETDLSLAALFEKTFSAFSLNANVGLLILGNPFSNATQDDLLSYGIACQIPRGQSLIYRLEVAGQALGTAHNERASVVGTLLFRNGNLTWNIVSRVGLFENSEDWGISGGVQWTFAGFAKRFSKE
jgi:hypothetical protein